MKRHAQPAVIFLALSAFFGVAQAQMTTPQPSGPPSAQPVPKSPSQPSVDSGAAVGGPQITLPLHRPIKDVEPMPESGDPPKPTKAQALEKCKSDPSRTARKECRARVNRDFKPAPNP